MGFETNLLIVADQRWAHYETPEAIFDPEWVPKILGEGPLWMLAGVVSVGRTTRLEKITDDHYRHLRDGYRGRSCAAICAVDALWREVVVGAIERLEFAPPFALFGRRNPHADICDLFERGEIKNGAAFVAPADIGSPLDANRRTAPSLRVIAQHNAAVALSARKLKALAAKHRFINSGPLVWSPVETVTVSLGNLLSGDGEAATALRQDPIATAFVESWRGYLAPLGKIGAMAIFDFEALSVPELT